MILCFWEDTKCCVLSPECTVLIEPGAMPLHKLLFQQLGQVVNKAQDLFLPRPSNQISLKVVTSGLGCLEPSPGAEAPCWLPSVVPKTGMSLLLPVPGIFSHCMGLPSSLPCVGFVLILGEQRGAKLMKIFCPSVSSLKLLSLRRPRLCGSGLAPAAAASMASFPTGHLPVHGLSLGIAQGCWHCRAV